MNTHNKQGEENAMTQGFQHQNQQTNFAFPKSAATPQHGQKADKQASKVKQNRSFQPRPGHG